MPEKILIYQVLPRLFGNNSTLNKENGTIEENGVGKFADFDDRALEEIKKMGFTHIWYTGVIEHASKTDYTNYGIPQDNPNVVKGRAGSPYAIRDYYDVSPDLATNVEDRMQEFEALIARTHKNGLKVIIDFVPNHVARQYHSDGRPPKTKDFGEDDNKELTFAPDNNYYYIPDQKLELQFPAEAKDNPYEEYPAKATGNDKFDNKPTKNDWYETVKLNYGIDYLNNHAKCFTPLPDTWLKMNDILNYWSDKGVDGFRCDMAEMVPVEFWSWCIPRVKNNKKGLIFIAEVYNPSQYKNYIELGQFDYLYDKVDLYDTLRNVICGRKPTSDITFSWQRIDGLQSRMLNFLENHDEQRIASDYFAGDPFRAIPGMIVSATMNTNPVMIYSGQELGEKGMDKEGYSGLDGRTTIYDYWSVATIRNWRNNGEFGDKKLTPEQKRLRKSYIKLLHIAGSEEAITQGKFFDLMYANYQNEKFDSTKIFAYLRCFKKDMILIMANFSPDKMPVTINIPQEAFDFAGIMPQRLKTVTELQTGKTTQLDSEWHKTFTADMDGFTGQLLKFSYVNE